LLTDQLYSKCSALSHLLSQLQQQRDKHSLQTFQQSPLPPMLARPLQDLSSALEFVLLTCVSLFFFIAIHPCSVYGFLQRRIQGGGAKASG
jgi:hypothetical protein